MADRPLKIIQEVDGIRFALREGQDFGWIREVGQVVCVFDQQDSGNICFGVRVPTSGRLRFIKYAGARTLHYQGEPFAAISRLRHAVKANLALAHPSLVAIEEHFPTPSGYAAIFEWVPGEDLHPHWRFPPPAKYTDPASPYFRFRQLPIEDRIAALDTILAFHQHVEKCGWVAVDFYDGSIIYDFRAGVTKICDIDFYQPKPYRNPIGRMWGSTRFMSPEEFILGAEIDERTNVFTMGATAFGLLGGERDHSLERWDASAALHAVAMRAVQPERTARWTNVAEMITAWNEAKWGRGRHALR